MPPLPNWPIILFPGMWRVALKLIESVVELVLIREALQGRKPALPCENLRTKEAGS